jgi:hypothetical protein
MNRRFFGCRRCKTYRDAGYRWAYWQLEHSGVVAIGEPISVEAVLAESDYWSPPAEERSRWLVEGVLPQVRRYLAAHRDHGILYIESELVFDAEGPFADWVEAANTGPGAAPENKREKGSG